MLSASLYPLRDADVPSQIWFTSAKACLRAVTSTAKVFLNCCFTAHLHFHWKRSQNKRVQDMTESKPEIKCAFQMWNF